MMKNMRSVLFIVVLVLSNSLSYAQAMLRPAIAGDEFPEDGSPIYTEKVPEVKGWDDFKGGFRTGTGMPDFTFYTLDGKPVTLSNVLKETHKPILLISGNYSCPVYRRNLDEINAITKFYQGRLNVYLVYTVEAHPVKGKQAYPLIPPAVKKNEMDGINMKQACTYLDRRRAVVKMNKHMDVMPTIVLDGPGNEWWRNAGYAPNNAYLINSKGVIIAKNGWFNPGMWCSIDKLLHTHSGHCEKPKHNKK